MKPKIVAVAVIAMASGATRIPREKNFLFTDAVSTIDSPESLAEYEKVINSQISRMKSELASTSVELKKYEDQFK